MKKGQPRKLCIFCSANNGLPKEVLRQAEIFCEQLAAIQGELLYGGSRDGLMGYFADQAMLRGVPVRGAITRHLDATYETAHRGITELVTVSDLFERKRWFIEQSDAFVVFPGGIGTLDEALEVITWKSLGEMAKPIIFVNIDGFWDSTFAMFADLLAKKVIRDEAMRCFETVTDARSVFSALKA